MGAIILRMRTCRTCGRGFRPSSRHHDCPACRSRDHCACGDPKQVKASSCWACWLRGGQVGSANHNWKGGRTKHHAGYLMVRMPDHPRARTQGYVFEHILVMEARLGRMLFADESVHHKNGIRDDNSPENLTLGPTPARPASELWTRSRGRGKSSTAIGNSTRHLQQRCIHTPCPATLLEVAGFEPACSGDHLGLLRAQPAYGSHLGVSTGGRPLGQPGCDVPRWPPGGALAVSLLSDARTPTAGTRGGRLPRD